ncbi:bifunctional DNA primase/polymerase [Streptomyces sp. NBC_00191]|uniref:bifunctional DNA primase/polymerase n=1 Tax=Streptomyces sp. NBC_00191 TaxID=2975674 RepID=UPI00324D37A4
MTDTRNPVLLKAALRAAERGWPVFPLRPGGKRPALHGERRCRRTRACVSGHLVPEQRATTDRDRIAQCWESGPFNVGIATGPSGLLVIDLDLPKGPDDLPSEEWSGMPDGMAVFSALCERAGQAVPTTHTVRTGRNGRHLYFTSDKRLRGSAGALGWKVDTRAWGGYVVAAGSTVNGQPYEVLDDRPPVSLPTWLIDLLTPPPAPKPVPVSVLQARIGRPDRYADAALTGEAAKVQSARQGGRNKALYNAAYALGRLVKAGALTEQDVTDTLTDAAVPTGLTPARIAASIRDGIRRGGANVQGGTA